MPNEVSIDHSETEGVETYIVTPKGPFREVEVRRVEAEALRIVPSLHHGRQYKAKQILPALWAETSKADHNRLGRILRYLVDNDRLGLCFAGLSSDHHSLYSRSI